MTLVSEALSEPSKPTYAEIKAALATWSAECAELIANLRPLPIKADEKGDDGRNREHSTARKAGTDGKQ